jgi:peroxiredoxin
MRNPCLNVFGSVFIGIVFFLTQQKPLEAAATLGCAAPDWQLTDVNGSFVSSSNFLGKVVILNFFQGLECPGCAAELPGLKDLEARYDSQSFELIGIAVDMDAAAAQAWLNANAVNFGVVLADQQILQDYRVQFTPTTYVVDRANIIRAYHFGIAQETALEREIEPLLGGPKLGIELSATDAVLWWPSSTVSFVLEYRNDQPAGLSEWSAVTNSVVLSGSNATVSIPRSSVNQFFRLRQL